jgi:L,D-peptidoglycan transpeptidase YkuD (ErfK/YbiS/YcfS/YnhG family)
MKRRDSQYRRAQIVEHNTIGPKAGAGSCIFLHQWRGAGEPVVGCTAMAASALDEVTDWSSAGTTVLVQLPRAAYRQLEKAWRLPAQ